MSDNVRLFKPADRPILEAPGRVMDYINLSVVSLTDLQNGYARLPAGTLWTVEKANRHLELASTACPCCGGVLRISAVPINHVNVIDTPQNREQLKENQRWILEKTSLGMRKRQLPAHKTYFNRE